MRYERRRQAPVCEEHVASLCPQVEAGIKS